MKSGTDLLKQCITYGFSINFISKAVQIDEDKLDRLLNDINYHLPDKEKEQYLRVFLMQLCFEKPENDGYYRNLYESLLHFFQIEPDIKHIQN